MRHGKETIKEARALILAMQRAGVPAFHADRLGLDEIALLQDLVNKAKRHHTLQTRYCSEEMNDETRAGCEAKEAHLEIDIQKIAKHFGLRVKFDGDPRGFTVKLHAPHGDVGNTWGGDSVGYGV